MLQRKEQLESMRYNFSVSIINQSSNWFTLSTPINYSWISGQQMLPVYIGNSVNYSPYPLQV